MEICNFSITQWNILAKSLCTQSSFPFVDQENLEWETRIKLFEKILMEINSDVFCFEEMDQINDFQKILKNFDFVYEKKQCSEDGIAIFYRKHKITLLECEKVNYINENGDAMNQFFLVLFLKINENYLCLIVTHLKAKEEFEKVRLIQCLHLQSYLESEKFLEKSKSLNINSLILTGDFNAEPSYESIKLISSIKIFSKKLNSVFSDSLFSTFKLRDKEYCRVIDHIFYCNLNLINKKELASKADLPPKGLPSSIFPSDHLYLNATFEFNS